MTISTATALAVLLVLPALTALAIARGPLAATICYLRWLRWSQRLIDTHGITKAAAILDATRPRAVPTVADAPAANRHLRAVAAPETRA